MSVLLQWAALIGGGFVLAPLLVVATNRRDRRTAARVAEEHRIAAPLAPARAELTAPWPPRLTPTDLHVAYEMADRDYVARHGCTAVATTSLSYEPWHAGRDHTGEFAAIVRGWVPADELVGSAT